MMGLSVGSTVVLCVAVGFVVWIIVIAGMGLKETRKRREFRRRGLS